MPGPGRQNQQRIGQQCDQRLELHVGRGGDLFVRPVQRPGSEPRLAVDQPGDPGVDGLRGDDAPRGHWFGLPDAVATVDGLGLLRVGPGHLGQHDVRGDLQIQAHASRGQRAHRDRDVRVVHEGFDVRLPRCGRLAATDRREAHPLPGEDLFGGVHHVDVLGEEDDLACAAGQLSRVVRGQFGLRLADAPHHGEHVLAGLRARRLLQLRLGHPADEVVVDALGADAGGSVRERGLVPRHHPASEVLFCLPDRPAGPFVQLNGEVSDTAGGDVGGHVELAPAHDAQVDHALARRGVEASVGRRQASVLKRVH